MDAVNRATGARITGTREMVPAQAQIMPGSFARGRDGTIEYEHEGTTHLDWNDQRTVLRDGATLFVDEDGALVTASEIALVAP